MAHDKSVEEILKNTPTGSINSAIGNNFYGINHRQTPGAIQINKDYYGLTFFTRPRLNLSTDNLRGVRLLAPLLTNNKDSIQRIIRVLLDPNVINANTGNQNTETGNNAGYESQFVDNNQAFIPILTNTLLSISGWPDVMVDTMTSAQGVYKEQYSMVDSVSTNYSTYDITANFRNIPGDPITALFLNWIHYSSLVYQGEITPYPQFIMENEIDYQTRIYRLVLDVNKQRVTKIGACGAAFPLNAPIAASFNYEHDKPINSSNDQISINFRCMGAMYQDDLLIDEFNRTTSLFNSKFHPEEFYMPFANQENGSTVFSNDYYTQIPMAALDLFNNRGYPRINPYSYELEWWIQNEHYDNVLPGLRNNPSEQKTVDESIFDARDLKLKQLNEEAADKFADARDLQLKNIRNTASI